MKVGRPTAIHASIPSQPAADLIQIQQIFVNLLVNAAQALAESPGRRDITVAIRRVDGSAAVDVIDTGPGIEVTARIVGPEDDDYARLFRIADENNSGRYTAYQKKTTRPITVIALAPKT